MTSGLVVGGTVGADVLLVDSSVDDVYILGLDVDMIQEVFVNAVAATLLLVGLNRIEFVKREDHHIAETDLACAVAIDKFAVEAERSLAGGKSECEGFAILKDCVGAA